MNSWKCLKVPFDFQCSYCYNIEQLEVTTCKQLQAADDKLYNNIISFEWTRSNANICWHAVAVLIAAGCRFNNVLIAPEPCLSLLVIACCCNQWSCCGSWMNLLECWSVIANRSVYTGTNRTVAIILELYWVNTAGHVVPEHSFRHQLNQNNLNRVRNYL